MNIGEISKITGLSISTLRYYDKNGLLPNLSRSNGIRKFNKDDLQTLKMINCLKISGMNIKEIKQFIDWCSIGDETIEKRLNMFIDQEKNINNQIKKLQDSLKLIKFKKWYYKKALDDKTENIVKNISVNNMPNDIKLLYMETH